MNPKITAILPYFGGKRNLAGRIVAELGPHRAYWEPFCGSMAVLLAKPECRMETVSDMNGDVCNLAAVIRDASMGPTLYRRLRRTLLSEDVYAIAAQVIRGSGIRVRMDDAERVERAYHFFLSSWFGRNGTCGVDPRRIGTTFSVRYTNNGGHAATRVCAAVDSIPAWRRRMRGTTILRRDGFAILERIEDAYGTAIYCDPPYVVKGAEYLHDFDAEDHPRLAELLRRFKRARVVVSYYEHPLVRELYDGWAFKSIDVSKALANAASRGTKGARGAELLISNGPGSESAGLFGRSHE